MALSKKVETAESRSHWWLSRKKIASSFDDEVISQNDVIRLSFPGFPCVWFSILLLLAAKRLSLSLISNPPR